MSSNLKVNAILPSTGTNVAIGTAGGSITMVGNIDINSGISTFNDIHISDKIVHDGDTNTSLRFPAADTISLDTAGSERLRINSDGKVGLGTTGSDYALSIREADNNNKFLMLQKNSGQEILQIREDGNNHAIIDGSHASGELHFYTAGVEKARITSDGQLGLNNASPDSWNTQYTSLQIHDAAVFYGSQDDSFVGLGANHYLNSGGNFIYSNSDFASRFYQVNGEFHFESASSGSAGGAITFTEKLRIDSSGNLFLRSASANYLVMGSSGDATSGGVTNNMNWIRGNQTNTQYNTAGGFHSFEVSGSEKLRISSAGSVTKPQQPYVHILGITNTGGSGNANSGSDTTYGAISYSAGRVTAQVEGNYMICFNTISDNGTGRVDAFIKVNGTSIVNLLTSSNGSGYRQKNGAIVYHLNVNDYVDFENQDWYNAGATNTTWKTASVYLLG